MNRLIPGLVLVVCWLLLLLYGSFHLFFPIILLVIIIGSWEYGRMTFPEKNIKFRFFFAFLVLLPALFTVLLPSLGLTGGLLLSFLILSGHILYQYSKLQEPMLLLSQACLGICYVGFLAAHLLLLYQLPEGHKWILVLTAITAGSDSGAYYCGRRFGKHKLCPLVSPNKTIEGAIGGLVVGVAVAAFMVILLDLEVSWFFLVPVAVLLTGVGIIGDLMESIIKRATSSKDSGTLLGGHGGVLDRVDSLLFAAPVLYYFLLYYHSLALVAR